MASSASAIASGHPLVTCTGARSRSEKGLLARLGVCVALAMNAMVFAFAGHFGLELEGGSLQRLFATLSMALSTIAVAVGGPVFFRAAWAGLRQRALHLDLPIALGLLLAWGGSMQAWLTQGAASYFDTVTVFVALMLGGRYLQLRAIARNRDFVLENDGAEHLRVRRLREGRIELAPVLDVRPGDELVSAPGDLVPVHATLLEGDGNAPGAARDGAEFSLDWIRGESDPRRFDVGERVPAGAFRGGDRAVRLVATADAHDSGLIDLLTTPEAGNGRAAVGDAEADRRDDLRQRATRGFWFQVNRFYVVAVLVLAAAAGVAWWFIDPTRMLDVVVATLVVTCPCALGIATPLAFELVPGSPATARQRCASTDPGVAST